MKKYSLIAAGLLLAFTGCGRGWLPFSCFNRGASCYEASCGPEIGAPLAYDGCVGCEQGASYGSIPSYPMEGTIIGGGESLPPPPSTSIPANR